MADYVYVSSQTTGVGVAAETIGTRSFQYVKLAAGGTTLTLPIDATTAAQPAASSVGVVVALKPGSSITVQDGQSVVAQVSGMVTMTSTAVATTTQAAVTGAVVWLAPTQTINVTATGQVSISGAAVTTTQANATALLMWLAPTQTMTVAISGTPDVTTTGVVAASSTGIVAIIKAGSVAISAMPAVSISVSAALGTVITVLGTVAVSQANLAVVTTAASVSVSGLPVWLNPTQQVVVSGLVGQSITGSVNIVSTAIVAGTVSLLNVAPVTTAASVSVTGIPVWLNPTQQVVVSGLVGQSITGSVNIVSTALVSIAASAILGTVVAVSGVTAVSAVSTVVTVLGTVAVSQVNIAVVTTAVSVSVSGLPVWLNPTQQVVVSGLAGHVVQISGTPDVTTTGVVAASSTGMIVVVKAGSVAVSGPALVSISVSAVLGTVITVLGTVAVSQANLVVVTTAVSVSVSGLPVWLNPTQQVVVSGLAGHSITGTVQPLYSTTAAPSISATGEIVWLAGVTSADISTATAAAGATGMVVRAAGSVLVSISVSATLGTIVTVLGAIVTGTVNNIPIGAGMVGMTVTSTSIIATSTTQFMLMTVNFDQYTSSVLVSGYTVRRPFAFTGISMIYSATSVTAVSVFLAVYVTTSGVSLTSNAMILWSTVFPTMTGAAVSTALVFPNTLLLPGGGVMGLAVYRSVSATVTANVAFSVTGTYIN